MNSSAMANGGKSPKIVWLGDDFTGAAAVMEVLSFSRIPSILFLDRPTPEQMAACDGIEAFGIATQSRAQSPEWMERHIPPLLEFLDRTGAGLVHYKICSTLDSAPDTGSIGKVIDLAIDRFGPATVPVLTAAPPIGRYQVFGDLFCAAGDTIYRLDRHPTMSRHPVTPMAEASVARHLSDQTDSPTRNLDLHGLAQPARAAALLDQVKGANLCTIDCLDETHLGTIGELLWNRRRESRFVVGSQGVEYALAAHFVETGATAEPEPPKGLGVDSRTAVVSGSVSPVTAAQIAWAAQNGFARIRVDAAQLCASAPDRETAEAEALEAAMHALSDGLCPLVLTAEGPDDPQVARLHKSVADPSAANDIIGQSLGRILARLIAAANLRRIVVSGGDTSGRVCAELGIYALEAAAPTIPGAAICRARSDNELNGLEIALKGGQMGSKD
ncbi:MAG: four-carbon acid sugar kinase family protein, partial [Paracoccaceae bacterium]